MRKDLIKLVNDLVKIERDINPDFQSKGNINPILITYYQAETGQNDFRTFNGWREAGMVVCKGEHGFPIFSRPINVIKEENGSEPKEDDIGRFGICYLFHAGQVQPSGNPAPEPIEPGKIKVVEYGEKSIVVTGDTRPIKDKLKAAGGKFNSALRCGPGWIFKREDLERVKEILTHASERREAVCLE